MIGIRKGYGQDSNMGGKSTSAARGSRFIVHSLCFVRHNTCVLLDGVESRKYKSVVIFIQYFCVDDCSVFDGVVIHLGEIMQMEPCNAHDEGNSYPVCRIEGHP